MDVQIKMLHQEGLVINAHQRIHDCFFECRRAIISRVCRCTLRRRVQTYPEQLVNDEQGWHPHDHIAEAPYSL